MDLNLLHRCSTAGRVGNQNHISMGEVQTSDPHGEATAQRRWVPSIAKLRNRAGADVTDVGLAPAAIAAARGERAPADHDETPSIR